MVDSGPQQNILLLGMKHSGKTTLGKRLAHRFHVEFADLDEIIERIFDPNRGSSCREIYRNKGKAYFVELETRAAAQLDETMRSRSTVAALGGGTIENRQAMDVLQDSGIKVYLKDAPSILFDRIIRNGVPAFLSPENPRLAFDALYERRTALFEQEADLVVDIDGQDVEGAFARLLDCLASASSGLRPH